MARTGRFVYFCFGIADGMVLVGSEIPRQDVEGYLGDCLSLNQGCLRRLRLIRWLPELFNQFELLDSMGLTLQ